MPISYGELSFSALRVEQGDTIRIIGTLDEFDSDTVTRIQISDYENKTILEKIDLPVMGKVEFDYNTEYLDVGNYTVLLENYDGGTETDMFYIISKSTDAGPTIPQIFSLEMLSSIIIKQLQAIFHIPT